MYRESLQLEARLLLTSAQSESARSQQIVSQRQQQQQQQFSLCKLEEIVWSPLHGSGPCGKGMAEICVDSEDERHGRHKQRVLLVRLGGDQLFALSPDCPNCQSPLAQGILCKTRVRCRVHGTAFDVRTGELKEGVGLDWVWAARARLVGAVLFTDLRPQVFGTPCTGPVQFLANSLPASVSPIVVVGAGIAGVTCVETLRHLGHTGPIVLIGRERELPYERKCLSKRLLDPAAEECVLRSRDFYEKLGVQLLLGHSLSAIRTEERSVLVQREGDGTPPSSAAVQCIQYAELVLALGTTNRRLHDVKEAHRLEGVLYLRTLEDARRMAAEVRGQHVAIIGSEFLGLELASCISPVARSVSVYGKAAAPLTVFGSEVGKEIRKFLQEEGVNVRQNSMLRSMDGYDRVQQLTFRDGLIAVAETVILAIGVTPCTAVLKDSGVRTNGDGYVLVDDHMRTNVPRVYACGDCVNFPLRLPGQPGSSHKRVNLPHWQIAQTQARIAAHSTLGVDFDGSLLVPFLWTQLFGKHIAFVGDPTTRPDERISRGSIATNDYVVYSVQGGRVIGVLSCGAANVAVQFAELFSAGKTVSRAEVERNQSDQWQKWIDEK